MLKLPCPCLVFNLYVCVCVTLYATAHINTASICMKIEFLFIPTDFLCVCKIQTYRDANSMTSKRRTPIFQS